jgi:hypothetical protein
MRHTVVYMYRSGTLVAPASHCCVHVPCITLLCTCTVEGLDLLLRHTAVYTRMYRSGTLLTPVSHCCVSVPSGTLMEKLCLYIETMLWEL